jgi:transketolase
MVSALECANALRILSIDAVQNANSGHPGMPMGMADIAQVLWQDFLRHNPQNPHWPNRDRFVLSNGHGSMLLYALLHLSGYDLSIDDLKQFRKLHSKTPGHPEYGRTPGVETTTGPLGQGLGNAVGMALAEAMLGAEFNTPQNTLIDHYTYCFVGDGCLMEGVSHEAASLAGTLGLGKLIVFWDNNGISIDGSVAPWFAEDTNERFRAYGWQVIGPIDGHHPYQIREAIIAAQQNITQPTLINCKTVIGFGAPEGLAGTAACHGSPLGEAVVSAVREGLGWVQEPFVIPQASYAAWDAKAKGAAMEAAWQDVMNRYAEQNPEKAQALQNRLHNQLPQELFENLNALMTQMEKKKQNIATRLASRQVLEYLIPKIPALIGGSADLSESNLTHTVFSKAIAPRQWEGNYIHYGVREFGMSTLMNGLALYGGFIPYGGTFLTFLDYARNAVRLACIMKLRVIFVYSHDSIGLGEDGPTHQPIEHLNLLRTTPNMSVWRPCDAAETVAAWKSALQRTDGPTSLILSRQVLPHQAKDQAMLLNVKRGAYILVDCVDPNVILIATGSEVQIAVLAAHRLAAENYRVRVVSMPCVDVFESQSADYQESVLPAAIKARVVIEAGSTAYWYKWVGLEGAVVGIDRYGESAPGSAIFEALGMTAAAVINVVKGLKNAA